MCICVCVCVCEGCSRMVTRSLMRKLCEYMRTVVLVKQISLSDSACYCFGLRINGFMLLFSPNCSKTWTFLCLIRRATLTSFEWSQLVTLLVHSGFDSRRRFFTFFSINTHARAISVRSTCLNIGPHTEIFRRTLYVNHWLISFTNVVEIYHEGFFCLKMVAFKHAPLGLLQ